MIKTGRMRVMIIIIIIIESGAEDANSVFIARTGSSPSPHHAGANPIRGIMIRRSGLAPSTLEATDFCLRVEGFGQVSPWVPSQRTFVRRVRSGRDVEGGSLSQTSLPRNTMLPSEFRDSTTSCCDVIPEGRFRQCVHMSAGVEVDLAVSPREWASSAHSLVTPHAFAGVVQQ